VACSWNPSAQGLHSEIDERGIPYGKLLRDHRFPCSMSDRVEMAPRRPPGGSSPAGRGQVLGEDRIEAGEQINVEAARKEVTGASTAGFGAPGSAHPRQTNAPLAARTHRGPPRRAFA
jgi:hypothetical protein